MAVLLTGCRLPSLAREPRRAILVVLDAARADRFSSYGYSRPTTPAIDALADRGLLFERHFAQGTVTTESLPALLYSRYFAPSVIPASHALQLVHPLDLFRTFDDEVISLPKLLAGAGLKTALISAHTWLREGIAFTSEFEEVHDLSATLAAANGAYPDARQTIDFTIDWLDRNLEEDLFLYVHLMDTHFPHLRNADAEAFLAGASFDAEGFLPDGSPASPQLPLSAGQRAYLDALYDGDLRFADRQIGRLVDFLAARGALDDTLLAITSDHGEFLVEQPGRFGHHEVWHDVLAHVPLVLVYPGRLPAGRVGALTEAVDLAPTLAALLGVGYPAGKHADGEDLAELARGARPPGEAAFAYNGVRTRELKCLFQSEPRQLLAPSAPRPAELLASVYDLRRDPGEVRDLATTRPDLVERCVELYRSALDAGYRRYEHATTHAPPSHPFAIAARWFDLPPGVPESAEPPPIKAPGTGWTVSRHWNRFFLAAAPGAEWLPVSFSAPNGAYRLSLRLSGGLVVRLARDGEELEVDGGRYRADPWWTRSAEVGIARVGGERFAIEIRPAGDRPVLIGSIELAPGEPSPPDAAERSRLERLRALGYLR